jgi:putative DNA primase/helicase
VARIYEPGCKLDTVLVLVGEQGARKSTALKTLFSAAWFADSMIDTRNKDSYMVLRGVWGYEWQEMDALKRSENTAAKAFLSSSHDTYRPSYSRNVVKVPRSTVFVGTANELDLSDTTGSRRYWPREVGVIDLEGLARDRSQLWAEAVARYRTGEQWWLDAVAEKSRAAAAGVYEREEVWLSPIEQHLAGKQVTTLAAVLLDLEVPRGMTTIAAQMRASKTLKLLGWRSRRRRVKGSKVREWYKP